MLLARFRSAASWAPVLQTARGFAAAPERESMSELQEFKEQVKTFAQRTIAPLAAEIDKNNDMPMHVWTEMGNFGLLGKSSPGAVRFCDLTRVLLMCACNVRARRHHSATGAVGKHGCECAGKAHLEAAAHPADVHMQRCSSYMRVELWIHTWTHGLDAWLPKLLLVSVDASHRSMVA